MRHPIANYLEGRIPVAIGLMHVLMAAESAHQARAVLAHVQAALDAEDSAAAQRLTRLTALWDETPDACEVVKRVLACVRHDDQGGSDVGSLSTWAAAFDQTAAISAEASVALYSLGRRDLLDHVTDEVVAAMRRWNLLKGGTALDLGCGIGRIAERVAPEMERVIGLDISCRMLATARRRCGGFPNIHLVRTGGRDLAAFRDAAFDLVYAVDTFPYLVLSGADLAKNHVCEAARVLRPGGVLLVLNYSYSGDLQLDRQDVGTAARAAGLRIVRNGTQEFASWDGAAFQMLRNA